MNKSPFYIVPEFVSPLLAEDIVDILDFNVPDETKDGKPVKTVKTSERAEALIYERLLLLLPELQAHYQLLYKGTERVQFEWTTAGTKVTQDDFVCENSELLRGKWLRTRQRDLTAILFLSEYQDKPAFDQEFEVYGGKLEFPQHQFGFNPQRGTLVVFPSDPRFINITSQVMIGDLYQARIQMAAQSPYIYNPQMFPGNYTTWF